MVKKALIFIPIIAICHLSHSQMTDGLTQYINNIQFFNHQNPQEKSYLHMDNRSYYIGDTIFFKAYVMNATTLHPTQTSGVLYVELLDERGIEVEHKKLKITGGMSDGSFILKDNYRTGYYELRAYTRHMLNFGNEPMPWINIQKYIHEMNLNPYAITTTQRRAATQASGNLLANIYPTPIWSQSVVADANHCVYSRVFPVYMRPDSLGEYKREMDWYPMHGKLAYPKEVDEDLRNDSLHLNFYPEGGALVAGTTSHVAVESFDQWGREVSVKGYITIGKSNNVPVAYFETKERGRGTFMLLPQEREEYYAHVSYKGKEYHYPLPIPESTGYTLHVMPPIGQGDTSFSIESSGVDASLIGWTILCRGALSVFDTLNVDQDTIQHITIPYHRLNPGVNQLTLFNARGEILAERLFFVSPQRKQAHLDLLTSLADSITPFEHISLSFQSKKANDFFVQSHFSISITDARERIATFDTGDLRSEMLLSSDLKGFVKDVDSYFKHDNDTIMANDIDLLMLVQGWRRYEWQTMAGVLEYTPLYSPESGLQLDGYVISDIAPETDFAQAASYKTLGNLAMHVSMKDPLITLSDTFHVDSLGQFHINFNKDFFGEIPMSMSLHEHDGIRKKDGIYSRLKFAYPVISRAFSPSTVPYNYYQNHTPEEESLQSLTDNQDWQMTMALPNVNVKKRNKQSRDINLESPDIVIDYYKEWNNIIDRGIPNANYYDSKDCYSDDKDRQMATAAIYGYGSEQATPQNENNEIRMHYTLGRSRLWGRVSRLSDSIYTYNEGRRNQKHVYLLPKTINVYTNLISRNALGTLIDAQTDTRPYVAWKPDYQKRSLSPKTAPYMLKDGVRHTYYEGYSRCVSFYHRDYSDCPLPDSTDYRRTLYWNPNVWSDHRGRVTVSFYNNARAKHLHIRAEGFTRNGEFIVYDSDDCL